VKARVNQALKVFAGPDVSQAEFIKACADAAREARDAELAKTVGALDKKIKTLQDKLGKEERELQQDQQDLKNRNLEGMANAGELIAGNLLGIGRKKSITTQFTKHRLSEDAKADVDESVQAIAEYQKDLADLQNQRGSAEAEINDRWGHVVNDISEVNVTPKKTDIYVNLFGVAWMPYYVVQAGGQTIELPAFGE
jgi:chaperonin cofactor prefoldin